MDSSHNEWQYEMRRDMQQVIPNLWIGPYSCARSWDRLSQDHITHILCLRDDKEAHIIKTPFSDRLVYCIISVADSPFENLIPHFSKASNFIHSSLSAGGRILVHCNGGISRSPAFVIAYLMEYQGLSFTNAYSTVQRGRFCMNPIEAFQYQLQEYEPILKARIAMASAPMDQSSKGVRRQFEEDEEEVMQNHAVMRH